MNYQEFRAQVQDFPIINSKDVLWKETGRQAVLNQFNRWQKRGLIFQLKRGMYLLNKNDRKILPSRLFLAHQLYGPSYVSLEYALGFYDLIPERVYDVTCVTTRKTMRFKNSEGVFTYQHIKPQAFRGFQMLKDESGLPFFMAEPEKAVVDFLYMNLHKFKKMDTDIFSLSYRFQNVAGLKQKRLMELAQLFSSQKLLLIVRLFNKFRKGDET